MKLFTLIITFFLLLKCNNSQQPSLTTTYNLDTTSQPCCQCAMTCGAFVDINGLITLQNSTAPYPCPCPQIRVICGNDNELEQNILTIYIVDGNSFQIDGSIDSALFECDTMGSWHYVNMSNGQFMQSIVASVNCVTITPATIMTTSTITTSTETSTPTNTPTSPTIPCNCGGSCGTFPIGANVGMIIVDPLPGCPCEGRSASCDIPSLTILAITFSDDSVLQLDEGPTLFPIFQCAPNLDGTSGWHYVENEDIDQLSPLPVISIDCPEPSTIAPTTAITPTTTITPCNQPPSTSMPCNCGGSCADFPIGTNASSIVIDPLASCPCEGRGAVCQPNTLTTLTITYANGRELNISPLPIPIFQCAPNLNGTNGWHYVENQSTDQLSQFDVTSVDCFC